MLRTLTWINSCRILDHTILRWWSCHYLSIIP
nr:MAG TPA: hypothetical protein [Caudoviricetes sp.]DAZ75286.1 MAG TPA: hypothetical protein [Caudoviricetes sp.]